MNQTTAQTRLPGDAPHGPSPGAEESVLTVLFTGHDDPQISGRGLDLAAQRGARLIVLYIIDSAVANAVFDKLTDLVFVGEKPSTQLANAILMEYEGRARDCLKEVADAAAGRGVACDTRLERGQLPEHVASVARANAVRDIYLTEPHRGFFMQFFSHSVAADLRRAGFNVHVVKSGGKNQMSKS